MGMDAHFRFSEPVVRIAKESFDKSSQGVPLPNLEVVQNPLKDQ